MSTFPSGLALAGAFLVVPDLRANLRHRLDAPGVLLVTAAVFCLIFGLIEGQRYDWGTVTGVITIPIIIGVGIGLFGIFVLQQWRFQGAEPLIPFAPFKDRNFTLMSLVLAGMGFAILGFFLPLTIYLQSVLGVSAVAAGLTIAAQPLAMMVTSGIAGGLTQKVNGKYLVIPGLVVFAAGMAYVDWAVHADSGRWTFLPGLILSGLGMGFIWTPVYSLATRDLPAEMGGVASGVISTLQEFGTVIASAVIGAVLQNRLAVALHDQAVARAGVLPQAFRGSFIDGFSHAGRSGLEVGAGQSGGSLSLPAGVPPAVAQQLRDLAHTVFANAFADAARPALLLPVAVILFLAVACLAARGGAAGAPESIPGEEAALAICYAQSDGILSQRNT